MKTKEDHFIDHQYRDLLKQSKMEHTNITKDEALKLMMSGYKITHEYYSDNEFLTWDNKAGTIRDENGYNMGSPYNKFWHEIQRWETGWNAYKL